MEAEAEQVQKTSQSSKGCMEGCAKGCLGSFIFLFIGLNVYVYYHFCQEPIYQLSRREILDVLFQHYKKSVPLQLPKHLRSKHFTKLVLYTHHSKNYFNGWVNPFPLLRLIRMRVDLNYYLARLVVIEALQSRGIYPKYIKKLSYIFIQHAIEWKLETTFTRQELFALHAQYRYFGKGYIGIEKAAKGYFNKLPSQLSKLEAAILAEHLIGGEHDDTKAMRKRAQERLKRMKEGLY